MRVIDIHTGIVVAKNCSADDVDFGILPNLTPGEYQVQFDNGELVWLHKEIGGKWMQYPYHVKIV